MKRIVLAAAIAFTYAESAVADFYVVENQSTHKCAIVTEEPMPGTLDVVVGDTGYKSRQEAEVEMRTAKACSNTPMGSDSSSTTTGK